MLISLLIHIRVGGKYVIRDVCFHRVFEHNASEFFLNDGELTFKHFTENTGQICTGILCEKVSAVKLDSLFDKFALALQLS